MTRIQKQIFYYLFAGCTIYPSRCDYYWIRTHGNSFAGKFHHRTYRGIAPYLRKNKKGLLELNKAEVLRLLGNSWIKKEYKKNRGKASMTFLIPRLKDEKILTIESEGQLALF